MLLAAVLAILSPAAVTAVVTFSNTARLSVNVGSDGLQAIALADVNKDNRPDIIAVNQNTNAVSVLLNDGNGGFGAGRSSFNVGAGPVAVATGDFDRDGNVDIVTVNSDSDSVTVLFGDSTGIFNAGRQDHGTNAIPVGIVVADLDNDLVPDLAVLNDSSVYLLKSAGDRTFAPFTPATIGTRSFGGSAIAVGLFNADAFPDLVIGNFDSDNVSVFLGRGNGTFNSAYLLNTGSGPAGLAVADFNGDGQQDIAVVDSGEIADQNVSLLFGIGDGTFAADQRTTAEVASIAIAATDLDANGRVDFAVTNVSGLDNTVNVLLYSPSAPSAENGFALQDVIPGLALGQGQVALQAADLNADGWRDLIALGEDTTTIGVFLNTTANQISTPTPSATPTPRIRLSIGSAVGRPGDTVDVTVSLVSSSVPVAATANDIVMVSGVFTLDDPVGCRVNPAIGKSLVVTAFPPDVFEFRVRVFVETAERPDPIPTGPLYTCTFRVAASAFPDSYGLLNENVAVFEPAGTQLADVAATDGVVIVSLVATPQPTHTPTAPPTAPPGGGGGGCAIGAPAPASPASNCLGVFGTLLLARCLSRRCRRASAGS
jgi:hypothetical protein